MDGFAENIKKNTRILLARNKPVALVVGAASFLGSYLVDKLLLKEIQIIGVDDLSEGKKENLVKAIENKDFHLIISSPEDLDLQLDRLDYIFILPQKKQNYEKVLSLFRLLRSRLLLISSIELYSQETLEDLKWLKDIELDVAKAAKNHNLNARILRLGVVFGPRMDFTALDPVIRLIQQGLTGDLQKETALEFSSRALYVDDACNLAIKCILGGATAQKIFDGVLPAPIKVSEIKQVLLDPIWYENKNFTPTQLPPWSTPNLEKTIKFLNWYPKQRLVESLRLTLSYFKDHEIKIPKLEVGSLKWEDGKKADKEWKKEKAKELEGLKKIDQADEKKQLKKESKKATRAAKFSLTSEKFLFLLVLIFIVFALVWPFVQLSWAVAFFRFQLSRSVNSLEKGEFEKSLSSVEQVREGARQINSVFYSLEPIRKMGLLQPQFELTDNLANLATLSSDAAQNTILGIQNLYQSLKSITGELNDPPSKYFDLAQTYLASSDEDLSKAFALIHSQDFKSSLPAILKSRVESLSERLTVILGLIKKARALSALLPEVVALDGRKDYLVLLQNNSELRPAGGFIGSFAKVGFEGGKLKTLEVNDIYAIDGQLNLHVEPPKEIKNDLNQKDYFLRDANFEPDFPTSARQIEWFYTKETGERVEGVVALDISAIEDLLKSLGSLNLADYNEHIDASNLFEKAISHAEVGFFPGTQAKKSFLTALTNALFNKLFFLPNQNWPGIVTSLGKSLEEKHMSIYLDDPKLLSYVISQNWASLMPRSGSAAEPNADFLAAVEANLGANKANYYLDRSYKLETVIGKEGEVNHRLRVSYTNRSPSDAFPAGKYKNRMRIYLPFGTKLNRALWAESDITKEVSSFVDYGRSGYSFLLELLPKEQKTLVLDYQTPLKLDFKKDKKATYKLDIIKQAGTLKDPFVWSVTYPINVKLTSNQAQKIGPQEYSIQTDLSTDKTFQLEFIR